MTGEERKGDDWSTVISSVKSPLGFVVLLALIINGLLVGASALTDRVPMWMPLMVLVLIIVMFFVTVWLRPMNLYHPKDLVASGVPEVKFRFPEGVDIVDLDEDKCTMTIKTHEGRKKVDGGTPHLVLGDGGWTLELPKDVEEGDSVRLMLVEYSGRKWRVYSFSPYEKTVTAHLAEADPGG